VRYSFVLTLLISLPCWTQTTTTGQAITNKPCSVANTGHANKIQITCGIGDKQGDQIIKLLNELITSQVDPMTLLANMKALENTSGLLEPDARPTPPGPWTQFPKEMFPAGALTVEFGGNIINVKGEKCTILSIADKPAFWIERGPKGILISARVFDSNRKILAEIDKNAVTINPNNTFHRYIETHSLKVVDDSDREVLHVDFVNPNWVSATGIFSLGENIRVDVTDDGGVVTYPRGQRVADDVTDCSRGQAVLVDSQGRTAVQ